MFALEKLFFVLGKLRCLHLESWFFVLGKLRFARGKLIYYIIYNFYSKWVSLETWLTASKKKLGTARAYRGAQGFTGGWLGGFALGKLMFALGKLIFLYLKSWFFCTWKANFVLGNFLHWGRLIFLHLGSWFFALGKLRFARGKLIFCTWEVDFLHLGS